MDKHTEMTYDQVLQLIERKVRAMGSQKEAAQTWGITEAYLSQILNRVKMPGQKILDALGIEHVDKYRFRKRGE